MLGIGKFLLLPGLEISNPIVCGTEDLSSSGLTSLNFTLKGKAWLSSSKTDITLSHFIDKTPPIMLIERESAWQQFIDSVYDLNDA